MEDNYFTMYAAAAKEGKGGCEIWIHTRMKHEKEKTEKRKE